MRLSGHRVRIGQLATGEALSLPPLYGIVLLPVGKGVCRSRKRAEVVS